MAIEVVCDCGQKLKAPDGFAGRRVRWPSCKSALAIPRPSPPTTASSRSTRNEARSFEPNDVATLSARFLDDSGEATIGPSGMAQIGPADDGLLQSRPQAPDLMAPASTSGVVPSGTRTIVFELTFRRRIGAAIDATADGLAFVLDDAETPSRAGVPPAALRHSARDSNILITRHARTD